MQEFKSVTKAKFLEFIQNYPQKLQSNPHYICVPSMISFNDFTRGNWPKSMVARSFPEVKEYEILSELL